MKLSLKNIGKIGSASVEINGITTIAGENNTGKSTVGRALFAVFNSFYNIEDQIKRERIQSVENNIDVLYRNMHYMRKIGVDSDEIAKNIVSNTEVYRDDVSAIEEELKSAMQQSINDMEEDVDEALIGEISARIKETLNVSDMELLKLVATKKLSAEFNAQVSNIFSEDTSEIELQIKKEPLVISLKDDMVTDIQRNGVSLHTEAIYVDDPFVLDEPRYGGFRFTSEYLDHRNHLKTKIHLTKDVNLVDEIVTGNKLQNIYEKISSVCSGEVVKKQWRLGYKRKDTDKVLDAKNLSTGFKTFAILKMLLLNGVIEYNGTIILDEPEIHLHPEWQLLFAELIVLIQKEFNMHILLNTHSPYFLRAIQVYSAKYKIADKCRYYLSEVSNDRAEIIDVTDNIEEVYAKLSRPLQQLEEETW